MSTYTLVAKDKQLKEDRMAGRKTPTLGMWTKHADAGYAIARVTSPDDGDTWHVTIVFMDADAAIAWVQAQTYSHGLYVDGRHVHIARIRAELPVVFAIVESFVAVSMPMPGARP